MLGSALLYGGQDGLTIGGSRRLKGVTTAGECYAGHPLAAMVASALGEIKEGRKGEVKCRLRLGKSYWSRSDLYPFADAVEAM